MPSPMDPSAPSAPPAPFDIQSLFRFPNPSPILNPNPLSNPNPNPNPQFQPFFPPASAQPPAPSPPPPHPFLFPRSSADPASHGARLMALLTPSAVPAPVQSPSSVPSGKVPRGTCLPGGEYVMYDVDVAVKGKGERGRNQLEVTPITKYSSDPTLVLGRQIAVNRNYICYGLKNGSVRVLNLSAGLRELLKGHTQRVSDMCFFAEDVSLLASASVEGNVVVWKIDEGLDEENKPLITGKVVIAIKMGDDKTSYQPRVCWHPHKQEVLVVGMGNIVLKIDTTKVSKAEEFSAEKPVVCSIDKLIEGVQFIGKHDGEVTDLSMSQWMTTRLVSASKDGTVKIWEDWKLVPLVTLRPYHGQPVYSAAFLTSPQQPEHTVLLTAGPLNRELKIWTSAGNEGWLLHSDSESWQCTQTLDLRSSAEPQFEEAFFNQIVVLPKANILLVANAKRNTIYSVHLDFGPYPSATRMDHIEDFTVTMPILSLTGTCDFVSDGEHVVQVFCVQTHAIQQYAMDVFQCLPPPIDHAEKSSISRIFRVSSSEGVCGVEPSRGPTNHDLPISSPKYPINVSSSEGAPFTRFPVILGTQEAIATSYFPVTSMETKPSTPPLLGTNDISPITCSPALSNIEVSGSSTDMRILPIFFDQEFPVGNHDVDQKALDSSAVVTNIHTDFRKEKSRGTNDSTKVLNSNMKFMPGGNPTHLITLAELLSGSVSTRESSLQDMEKGLAEIQDLPANQDIERQHEVDGSDFTLKDGFVSKKGSQVASAENIKCSNSSHKNNLKLGTEAVSEGPTIEERDPSVDQPFADDGTNQMMNSFPGSAISTSFSSPFTSTNSSIEPESSYPSANAVFSQLKTLQEMLSQLMAMQKETHKQISAMVSAPITKEGKRMEVSIGRSLEKTIKANVDTHWSHFQEENAKHEKLERDRLQQATNVVANCISKDLPAMLDRTLKKEIPGVAPIIARVANPIIEKSVSSAIIDSFQRGVGDKAVNLLEKSFNSKVEATVSRQIQTQFQTSGKQALQDGLRTCLESKAIPSLENGCKAMFDQVNAAVLKGMTEHTFAAREQLESTDTSLALTLREAISSVSSINQTFASELAEGHRNIIALLTAGNTKALNPMASRQNNGLSSLQHEMQLEITLDPKKELTRLLSECKFEETFTLALQRSDVSIVSWVCSQVDLHGICSMSPLPLSQGVLLSLLQQLACDISSETSHKVGWMRDVALAINLSDPMITPHVRPIFEQVYNRLLHQRSVPKTTPSEATSIQVTMHVINSLLMSCK